VEQGEHPDHDDHNDDEPHGGIFEGEFFHGDYDQIPDIDSLGDPELIADSDVLDLDSSKFEELGLHDHFAARWIGDVGIHTGGTYTFFVRSDDGSKLYINGDLVVDNDGLHGAEEEKSGTVDLEAGDHPVHVDFFEKEVGANLHVKYSGPDTDGQQEFLHSVMGPPHPQPTGPQPSELGTLNMYCRSYLTEAAKENPRSDKLTKNLGKCRGQDLQQAEEDIGCHYMTPEGFCYTDVGQHWCAENPHNSWCITDVEPLYETFAGHGVMPAWEAASHAAKAGVTSLRAGGRGRLGGAKAAAAHVQRAMSWSPKIRGNLAAERKRARKDSVADSEALRKIRRDLKDIHVTEEVSRSELVRNACQLALVTGDTSSE
jgi:hypothetical protein